MSNKKSFILNLVQKSLRKFPAPASITLYSNLLKMVYSYSSPFSNSKSTKDTFLPIQLNKQSSLKPDQKIMHEIQSLSWDQKTNVLKQNNTFDTILTQEHHEKVLMDDVFGKPVLSQDKKRWVYIAKKKNKKPKSYLLEGFGKDQFLPDFGELYDDVNDVGIFVWDIENKKVVQIEVKREDSKDKYILANPIFMNKNGTKILCHGYKRTQFGHGILHCFNRPVSIFQVTIPETFKIPENKQQKKQQKQKPKYNFSSKILINKHETNIFANISKCSNYILYFGGKGVTHTYYMDLIVLKKQGDSWQQVHRIKQAFVGYYDTAKSLTFQLDGQPYAYFQTIQHALHVIKCLNLKTGQCSLVKGCKAGQSVSISNYSVEQKVALGTISCHQYNSFFYLPFGGEIQIIQPLAGFDAASDIELQEYQQPIHGYYLESKQKCQSLQLQKQKKPLIVLVHGGPHGSSEPIFTLMRYMFLKCGYAILLPNYSGSVGFGPDYLNKSLGKIGETDADQIIKLLEKVLEQKPHLDKQNVHVYGGSYGGYMGAIMGTRHHKYFKKAIILNGVLSIPANYWFTDIPQWNLAQTLNSNQMTGLKHQHYEAMLRQSPITEPMKIPTLQFLGAKDRRVPFRQGLLFDAITKKHGTSISTFVYENSGHALADSVETGIDIILKSMFFFEDIQLKQQ